MKQRAVSSALAILALSILLALSAASPALGDPLAQVTPTPTPPGSTGLGHLLGMISAALRGGPNAEAIAAIQRYAGIERGTTEDGMPQLGSPDAPAVLHQYSSYL